METTQKTVLDIVEEHGLQPESKGYTNAGEFASPCPFCEEGEDRFVIWPNHGNGAGGRFWCRQCQKSGDAVQLLAQLEGIEEREAMKRLQTTRQAVQAARGRAREETKQRKRTPPPSVWQEAADKLVRICAKELWNYGDRALDWLTRERGLNEQTIRQAELGFLPKDQWDEGDNWGLQMEFNSSTGKRRKLWFPGPSLLIPGRLDGLVQRLRFRLFNRQRDWIEDGESLPRYMALRGSVADSPLLLGLEPGKPVVVVESDLCGLLVHQEAGDLVGVVALGAAGYRPSRLDRIVSENTPVLVSLDQDKTGYSYAQTCWIKPHPEVAVLLRLPKGTGKDPTEAWQAGVDLREWVATGLEKSHTELEERRMKAEEEFGKIPF